MQMSEGNQPFSNAQLNDLFRTVGFIVVQWGQAEQSLDLATSLLYQVPGAKGLSQRLPKMLDPKLEFVLKCIERIPSLGCFKGQGGKLVEDFRRLAPMRHDIVHGAIASLAPVNGEFSFAKLDIKENVHHVREVSLDLKAFPTLADDLIALGKDSIKFSVGLHQYLRRTGNLAGNSS